MFKNIQLVHKKVKGDYTLRLATKEEIKQQYNATAPSFKTGIKKEDRPKKIAGFHDCVLYPPSYKNNTIMIQGDGMIAEVNYKTNNGKIFIKGMPGYKGTYFNFPVLSAYGIDFNFDNEIVTQLLNTLPAKDTVINNKGLSVVY